jgi:DNA-binding transcriptional LysR family regulator
MIETRLLEMFIATAKQGTLVAASRECRVTASAVSHALKALESELGCRLFDRIGKNVQLNQAGEQFLAQVEPLLKELDAAANSLKDLRQWGETRLRIGASTTFCHYVLPRILKDLKKTFGTVAIQVESRDTGEQIDLLRRNKLDLGIGLMPDEDVYLDKKTLFRDELLLTLAPNHPLASLKSIPRDQLSNYPFILYRRGSITSRLVDDYFRAQKIRPNMMMEVSDLEAIKELVKLNLGLGIMAPWTASRELERGTLVMRPLGTTKLKRQWTILSQNNRRLNLIEIAFVKLCRQFATTVRTDREDLPAEQKFS